MSEPEFEPERRRGGGCVASALLVLGLLILVPSGLCTGILILGSHITLNDVGMALTFGGPFIVIGGLLTVLGITLLRRG